MAMPPPRFPFVIPGVGPTDIPYDQSGGPDMSAQGMNIPQPGAPMKSMKFDFHDPAAQAAAQAQAQPAVQPNGVLPPGATSPAPAPQVEQPPPSNFGNVFGGMAGGADQFGQGPNSSMFTDDQLAALANEQGPVNPIDMQADSLEQQLAQDPSLQLRMMDAARRMGGF